MNKIEQLLYKLKKLYYKLAGHENYHKMVLREKYCSKCPRSNMKCFIDLQGGHCVWEDDE